MTCYVNFYQVLILWGHYNFLHFKQFFSTSLDGFFMLSNKQFNFQVVLPKWKQTEISRMAQMVSQPSDLLQKSLWLCLFFHRPEK